MRILLWSHTRQSMEALYDTYEQLYQGLALIWMTHCP